MVIHLQGGGGAQKSEGATAKVGEGCSNCVSGDPPEPQRSEHCLVRGEAGAHYNISEYWDIVLLWILQFWDLAKCGFGYFQLGGSRCSALACLMEATWSATTMQQCPGDSCAFGGSMRYDECARLTERWRGRREPASVGREVWTAGACKCVGGEVWTAGAREWERRCGYACRTDVVGDV